MNLLSEARRGNASAAARLLLNRLQPVARRLSPWIDRLHDEFARLNFLGHQMSGSGTSYFGICRHARHARRAAEVLRGRRLGLVVPATSLGQSRYVDRLASQN